MTLIESDYNKLRVEHNKLQVANAEKDLKINELEVNSELLEKQLGLRDDSLNKKLLLFDEKFNKVIEENDKVMK